MTSLKTRRTLKHTTHSLFTRSMSWILVTTQVFLAVPIASAAPKEEKKPKPEAPATPPPPAVKVNRTVPKVTPPPEAPHFSKEPTDEEIFRARVFEEPLVPLGHPTSVEENEALASALVSYLDGGSSDALGGLEAFLSAHPGSAWRAALLLDMGIVYRRTGYFTKALGAWKEAWDLSKGEIEPKGRAVADRALADLATLDARLGRVEDLEALLGETQGRDIHGSASEKLNQAREGLWLMQHKPERAPSLLIGSWPWRARTTRATPTSWPTLRLPRGRPSLSSRSSPRASVCR